jgi:hypothetical protein
MVPCHRRNVSPAVAVPQSQLQPTQSKTPKPIGRGGELNLQAMEFTPQIGDLMFHFYSSRCNHSIVISWFTPNVASVFPIKGGQRRRPHDSDRVDLRPDFLETPTGIESREPARGSKCDR